MSQGPYPPGYEPPDGAQPPGRPPREGYPDAPTGRASARVPQPDWSQQQRPDAGAPSNYPTPQYAGPESPSDPHSAYRRPGQPPFGGAEQQQQPGFGGQGGGFGGTYGASGTPTFQPPGQYGEPGEPGRPSQYGDPTQYGGGDRGPEGRFSALRYDEAPGGPGGPPPAKSKRGLIIGVVIAAVAVLALAAVGVTWMLSSKSSNNFAVNSCVKRSGDKAETVSCSTSGSYQIVSKVGSPSQCPDQGQPYVILQEKGKTDQVLCLKPSK
jgi:hypothetical protein